MSPISKSTLSVQYDLRPAKQVERRMLMDAFQRLAQVNFPIREYQYTGFGSIYFVDFLIFHKLLGIDDMLSVEHDLELENRVKFNCPFDCISVEMSSSTDVITTLSQDKRHILWLDYDEAIKESILNDLYLAGGQLSRGSFLIITVDVESPEKGSDEPQKSKEYFEREAGKFIGTLEITDFTKGNLHKTNKKVIINAIKEGIVGRPGIDFHPLFYFLYADGHRMMTIGGMIGSDVEKRNMNSINMDGAIYLRMKIDDEPYEIKVPPFTRKERHLMDSAMPCDRGWQPVEFSIPEEHVEIYREIYRFLPAYAELLI